MSQHMWNERFSAPGFAYGDQPQAFLRTVASGLPCGDIVCLAEGEGRNAVFLASLGNRVTAVDWSEAGLAKIQALASIHQVQVDTVLSDITTYDAGSAAWDGIVLVFAHLPPRQRAALHQACVRALKPGGWLVLVAYTPRQLAWGTGGPKDPELLMEPETIRRELRGLRMERLEEIETHLEEGAYHVGQSALLQVLARKPEA